MVFSSTQGVAVQELDWTLSTIQVFERLSSLPWAMLLDSANAGHIDANVDIIVCEPLATVTSCGENTLIDYCVPRDNQQPRRYTSKADPFSLLQDLIQECFPRQCSSSLPFNGGALGAFSYDLGRRIELLPTQAQQDIDLPEMNVGLYDWALIRHCDSGNWSLMHYHGDAALTKRLRWLERRLFATAKAGKHLGRFHLTQGWQPQISRDAYQCKFDQVQAYLHSGDCYQINLTQRFEAQYQGDEWQAYLKLRESNKAPFSAFIRLPSHALLSISPERFIKLNAQHIQTKPIKGTIARDSDPQRDRAAATALSQSVKDRAENVMIVDLLRNDIGKVAQAGSVAVPQLFAIESFPAVHHLVSTVTATLDEKHSPCDLLKAAFPGGSITGAPKIRAMAIIEELEPSRRSLYCGSIGYIGQDGQMDTSITIRTLVAQPPMLYCWAGGGIVADSKADAEYQESYDKVSKILPILQD